MKYPRFMTVVAAIAVPLILFLLIHESPDLSDAASKGHQFGFKIDFLAIMFVALINGIRVWHRQAAMKEAFDRSKSDIAEAVSYPRYLLPIIALLLFAAIPLLTAILFTLN